MAERQQLALFPELRSASGPAKHRQPPSWFVGGTHGQRILAVLGLHPLGRALASNGETCGTCAHLCRKLLAKTYLKCSLQRPEGCASSDVREKWPACDLWAPKPEGVVP